MKNYKEQEKVTLGYSDIASVVARSPERAEAILFGADNKYYAYLVDWETEIPQYYNKVFECSSWLKIYDDEGLTLDLKGDSFEIYRAAEMGCIIRSLNLSK